MTTQSTDNSCTKKCWGLGLILGLVIAVILMIAGSSFLWALVLGGLACLAIGWLLSTKYCQNSAPEAAVASPATAAKTATPKAATPAPESVTPTSVAEAAPNATPDPAPADDAAEHAPVSEAPMAPKDADEAPTGKPESLSAPRDGVSDDLKKIKGVGPKLEGVLHELGFYHFDQIANWTEADVAWVDDNLQGFRGRATRDEWVDQAKKLAAGGETAFSKRVEDGDVY